MGDEVILLGYWMSPNAIRVRIALEEKGVEYEYREEDLRNKSELLLKSNPIYKQIPVLIHNGKPICGSLVILEYIEEMWSHKAPLLPSDPYERAKARFWADYIEKKMFEPAHVIFGSSGETQERALKDVLEGFKLVEQELGDKPFFGGENLGFLDVTLVPLYDTFSAIESVGKFSFAEECPKIMAWVERCLQKENVAKCQPDGQRVYEYLLGFLRKHGNQ